MQKVGQDLSGKWITVTVWCRKQTNKQVYILNTCSYLHILLFFDLLHSVSRLTWRQNELPPHYILEDFNFNFRYVRLCDLDIPKEYSWIVCKQILQWKLWSDAMFCGIDLGLHCSNYTFRGLQTVTGNTFPIAPNPTPFSSWKYCVFFCFFLFLHKNMLWVLIWSMLARHHTSNEYPQHMFTWRNKKHFFQSCLTF